MVRSTPSGLRDTVMKPISIPSAPAWSISGSALRWTQVRPLTPSMLIWPFQSPYFTDKVISYKFLEKMNAKSVEKYTGDANS